MSSANPLASCGSLTCLDRASSPLPGLITFVEDHLRAMDPCVNPELLKSHSFYTTPRTAKSLPRPHTRLLPILSLSRTPLSADIPLAPVGILSSLPQRSDVGREPEGGWTAKSNKLYWRGSPTAHREVLSAKAWDVGHKTRLHQLATSNSTMPVPLLVPAPNRDGTVKVVEVEETKAAEAYFDIRLQGGWNCEGPYRLPSPSAVPLHRSQGGPLTAACLRPSQTAPSSASTTSA